MFWFRASLVPLLLLRARRERVIRRWGNPRNTTSVFTGTATPRTATNTRRWRALNHPTSKSRDQLATWTPSTACRRTTWRWPSRGANPSANPAHKARSCTIAGPGQSENWTPLPCRTDNLEKPTTWIPVSTGRRLPWRRHWRVSSSERDGLVVKLLFNHTACRCLISIQ